MDKQLVTSSLENLKLSLKKSNKPIERIILRHFITIKKKELKEHKKKENIRKNALNKLYEMSINEKENEKIEDSNSELEKVLNDFYK